MTGTDTVSGQENYAPSMRGGREFRSRAALVGCIEKDKSGGNRGRSNPPEK
jgi:hypothetical protein